MLGRLLAWLKEENILTYIDDTFLKEGDSIKQFEEFLARQWFTCIFISQSYLESSSCLFELSGIYRRLKENSAHSRCMVFASSNFRFFSSGERLKYAASWKERYEALKTTIEKVDFQVSDETKLELERFDYYYKNIEKMLAFFGEPLAFTDEARFLNEIKGIFSVDQALCNTYCGNVERIQNTLLDAGKAGAYFNQCLPDLFQKTEGDEEISFTLPDAFNLGSCLSRLRKRVAFFHRLNSHELECVGLIMGCLVVLAINKDWILRHRSNSFSDLSEFPADDNVVEISGKRRVNLLHLLVQALADGPARLNEVFLGMDKSAKHIDLSEAAMDVIKSSDRNRRIQLYLIRKVLGTELGEVDETQIELKFRRVSDELMKQLKEGQPYSVSGLDGNNKSYLITVKSIRQLMQIETLAIVYANRKDYPDAILPNHHSILVDLSEIYQAIQKRQGELLK